MDAAMPPQPQALQQPGAKESARGTTPNKGLSPIFVILLLSLIPVMFGCALAIRYATRGPRVVHTEVAPTTVANTTAAVTITTTATPLLWPSATSSESQVTESHVIESPVTEPEITEPHVTESTVTEPNVTESTVTESTATESTVSEPNVTESTVTESIVTEPNATEPNVTEVDLTVPYQPKPGTAVHAGDLPGDVTPEGYEVTITLNGTSLADDTMQVTGKAVISYKVVQATSKLVLKALSETIKNVKMALLEAAPADGKADGLSITTLSSSDPFLIATLEKPLTKNNLYTLVAEYDYDKAAQEGPIELAAE
nr:mucin-2-like [Dermacentor andersoni]